MLGPDAVSASTRLPAVQMDTRGQWVQTPVAQQLGLRDGQIVQATAEIRDQRVRLWVKDFFFELPNGWVLKDGDKPFLRASQNAGSWGFLIQSYPSGQTSTATPASAAFGLNPQPALNPALTLPSTAVGLLLTQPTGFASFTRMLAGWGLRNLSGQSEFTDMVKRLLQQRSSMAQMNPITLKRLVSGQARSSEYLLAKGLPASDDPKSIIKHMLALLQQETVLGIGQKDTVELEQALRELESAQAQAAQKWLNGELSLHVVLPFVDHEPVDLHFQKPARKPNQEEPPLTVDIHSRSRLLGEIWLNTTISQGSAVDLVMWALRSDVAGMAKQRAAELGLELDAAGLTLKSFQIFHAARPLVRASEASGSRGSVIDTQA
ncbi:MAG: hypothetical protein ACKO5X_01290 [Limnohabitans sp.]